MLRFNVQSFQSQNVLTLFLISLKRQKVLMAKMHIGLKLYIKTDGSLGIWNTLILLFGIIKLYTPMEHQIISQRITLTMPWSFFCEQILKRNINHRYFSFYFLNFPTSKSWCPLSTTPTIASKPLSTVTDKKGT